MEREEAIKYIKSRCIGSTEERDGTQWSEAMWTAIEALADRPTGEWISEELANMICNEICYYKEVTVDADSLNDLCEGCLIKKKKYDKPTGKWIKSDILPNGWHCSHCDSPVMTDDISEMLFCPHCGSYNGGEEE